ncbi:DUF7331 family protein [Halomicrococcus sp. SG-WS-1]|uniref:DUF7331 family protein n=1 Tax=Halomicrococcus sp. SG-WS-1 TaxID=3439057 RepID=UPI003F7AD561
MTSSEHESDDTAEETRDDSQWTRDTDERYVELRVRDGDVLIYDRRNNCAWLSSDGAVSLSAIA